MLGSLTPKYLLVMVVAFLSALTIHEYAHGRAALAAGDDTAKRAGRLTLNPIAHLDLWGSIFFLIMLASGFGIGWAKPVPVNPTNFKNPRWDNLKVSIWGPLSNMLFAIVLAVLFRFVIVPFAPAYINLIVNCILVNIMLAIFNLLPIPPLDGSHIISSILPTEAARKFDYAMGRYGLIFLMLLFFAGNSVLGPLIIQPVYAVFHLLVPT